jgi:hypothetical protein
LQNSISLSRSSTTARCGLELFAKLDLPLALEHDGEVRRRRITVGAAASLRLEVDAMLAREAELELRGLFA